MLHQRLLNWSRVHYFNDVTAYSTSLWRRLSSLVEEGSSLPHTDSQEEGSSGSTSLGCDLSGCSSPVTPTCCPGCPEGHQRWHLWSRGQYFLKSFWNKLKFWFGFFKVLLRLQVQVQQLVLNVWMRSGNLTSEPGGAVGFSRRSVYTEALAGEHFAVLGFLSQEAYLCQQAMQEARQHGRASDHHQVLREHFTGVDGALKTNKHTVTRLNHLHEDHFLSSKGGLCLLWGPVFVSREIIYFPSHHHSMSK